MKKKILGSLVACSLLTTAIYANEDNNTSKKYGMGISIGSSSNIVRLPIDMSNDMRLEPYIGFKFNDNDYGSSTNVQAGIALEKMYTIESNLKGYYGAFLGVESYSGGETTTSAALGPIIGAEYYLNDKFCIGAEVRINAILGDTTTVETDTSALIRYYF